MAACICRHAEAGLRRRQTEIALDLLEDEVERPDRSQNPVAGFFGLLVPYLSDIQVRWAFSIAMLHRERRPLILALAARLTSQERRTAIAVELGAAETRAFGIDDFVNGLLPHLDPPEVAYLVERSRRIGDDDAYVSALVELMPLLTSRGLEDLRTDVLDACIADGRFRDPCSLGLVRAHPLVPLLDEDQLEPVSRRLGDREAWMELREELVDCDRAEAMRGLSRAASTPAGIGSGFPDRLAEALVDVKEWWP